MATNFGMDAAEIDKNIEEFDKVQVANYNCPGQIVISGETEQVKQASRQIKRSWSKKSCSFKRKRTISLKPSYRSR